MIFFSGVVEAHLTIDGEKSALKAGGYLYETARAVRRNVDSRVGILARLGNDGPGRIILESLVHDRIVFDPDLVCGDQPSFLVVEDMQGRTSCYSSFTCSTSASSQELTRSLDENSDVDIVVMCAGALYHQPLFSSILDAATFHTPRPMLVLDVASSTYDHPDDVRLSRQIRQALSCADVLILGQDDMHLFDNEDVKTLAPEVFMVQGCSLSRWKDGRHVSTQDGDRLDIYRQLCSRMG